MKKLTFILFFITNICFSQLFGSRQIINENAGTVRVIRAADFDNDGDLDLCASANNIIAWYKNLDGQGNFSEPIPIQENMGQSFDLSLGDIDNDGNIDIIVSYFDNDKVVWYRNEGGGNFGSLRLISNGVNRGVTVRDMDDDGDNDIVLGVSNGIGLYWVKNLDGFGTFSNLITIDGNLEQARTQSVEDIDGDGDLDILTNGIYPFLLWYENTDGNGNFENTHVIDSIGLYENDIGLFDLDGDGDYDILSQKDDKVIWRENIDGQGIYTNFKIITAEALGITDITAADLDNDGDMDVLSASFDDNKIAWYENLDGLGNFGFQQVIDIDLEWPRTLCLADFDNDGDKDLSTAALSNNDRRMVWYKNNTILSVGDNVIIDFKLYPNPSTGIIFFENYEDNIIEIYNVLGGKVIETKIENGQIDITKLSSGIYFISFPEKQNYNFIKIIKL